MIKKSMTGMLLVGLISASLFLTSACSQVRVPPEPDGPTQEEIDAQNEIKRQEEIKKQAAEDARRKAEEDAAAAERQRIEREKEEAARQAKADMEDEKIYFDYDSSELKPEAQAVLDKKAEWLNENSEYKIKIGGHCDNRGSTEYNLALGAKRAEAAAKYLSASGISSSRIATVSFGEEQPAVDGNNEAAWSQNRRDEFTLMD